MITSINVNRIVNHVNNPRKAYGDLTELRDSIARNGILQPLTVVPFENDYKVVIGHRRLEAAKQAGLEEVPCEVKEMSEEDQLNVMMMENMLRENLTAYEEAKGFQLMLDLGKSVETIAEETGFSQTTVRNRTRLLSLDETKFKDSVKRGATLSDLNKLYDIDDEHTRNAVLKYAGTNDFESKVKTAVQNQEDEKKVQAALEEARKWATEVESKAEIGKPVHYVGNISKYYPRVPAHEDNKVYYMVKTSCGYDILEEGDDTEEAERKARQEKAQRISSSLSREAKACYDLRTEFIRNFGNFRKYGKAIMTKFMQCALRDMNRTSWRSYDLQDLGNVLGVEDLENNLDRLNDFAMEKVALAAISVYLDKDTACTWGDHWNGTEYVYIYEGNDKLMDWYAFLLSIGYQPSTQETNMLNGDVEFVQKKEVA